MNVNSDLSIELLYEAVLCLKTKEECELFFDDLCTSLELSSISQRFLVAKMLDQKHIYNDISKATGASTATISRVNRTLNSKHSGEGYRVVLDRLSEKGIIAPEKEGNVPDGGLQ